MLNIPHPDQEKIQTAVKSITRGGRQAAESAAMEAMFDAISSGMSKGEAEKIFNDIYKQFLNKKP